ncbi:hypothetical protein F3Y22_tig00110893pilonHSYRG01320 [Hibiscus syriacus]|uniref:Reverse transcriptase domain-containing protein n=1 Tax=Hibiscus syriacus TaxID=106335 RepID=A0A6A2ZJL3_HIBSY|nr:hypothetical protein F3Y22_tig00110893pilonHSYRG01320 [Hibiscus syriacus]
MVKNVFAGGDIEADLNKTVLVLISKKEGPETFADFHPISLCTVMYKLITKIIVRRIKQVMPILIMPNQTSFVAGRSITENIIINQEVIHSMRQLKTKQGWMAIKMDLEKAFDSLRWEFIQDSLTEAGFPPCTIRLIMHCITSTSMQIQWNGENSSAFQPERGIRQGNPLSPYLFVLAMKRLGHSIRKCVEEGDWKGYYFSRQGLSISHLFFADDLMLYAKADLHHAEIIEKTLKEFGYFLGHKVSKRKTRIYFSPNTTISTKSSILSCLGFQEVESMGKYLGVPVLHRRMKIADFDFIFDKFRNYARDDIHADLTQKIHNFVDVHGHWDVAALSQVLIPAAILHVISVLPPDRNDKPDTLIWIWTPELNFTIKSAYTFLMEGNWNEKSSICKGAASTWSSPPRGWTCLNTDGAVATLDGRGSIGGVFRNSTCDWIIGFTKNIGTTSALHAELWSIYEGLLISRSFGVSRLLVQSNCSKAVKLIEDSAAIDSHIPLVRAILKQRSLIRFDSPPDELVDLLRIEAADAQQDDATRHA